MQLRRTVTVIFNRVLDVLFILSTALLILISVTILVEVVTRTFFRLPITGTIEITGYCLASVTFLGTAWLLKDGGHVKMDLLLAQLKPRAQAILNSVTSAMGAIACMIIAWYAAKATLYSYQTSYFAFSELEVPTYPIMFIITLGMFLLSIQFLRNTHGYLRGEVREIQVEERI